MKAIKNVFSLKALTGQTVVFILMLASCQKDNDILTSIDTQNVNGESVGSSYMTESSDISTNAIGGLSTTQYSGARMDGDPVLGLDIRDGRFKCATTTISRAGTKDNPAGTITISFNPNCTDNPGIKRSGTIVISYKGRRWVPGSYFVVKADFYRNGAHIEGTDTVTTKLSADTLVSRGGFLQFRSVLTGGQVTFADGKTVTREHDITREWFRGAVPTNDEWHTLAGGTATGTCKNGNTYEMQITKTLVHKLSCLGSKVVIPVSGTKVVTVTGTKNKQYSIDYGDGTCDNTVTVTVGSKVQTITVNGDGN
ncbi:hypothetical protein WSM22_32150 [Cytophagales bacterium WSM2-2]|nr:hypothetical protein WSM22_32150 [Cytophagales bacterium WSM2-2]